MPGDKRSAIQRDRDRQAVTELMLKGWTYQKIADYLETSAPTVCRDVAFIKQAWLDAAIEDRNLYVQQEMARLGMVESEYWAGWERSQQAIVTATESEDGAAMDAIEAQMTEAVGGAIVKATKRTQTTPGNPQFLGGIVKVVEIRCKLLGLFPDGSTSAGQLQMSDQQLAVLGQLMQESRTNG
jgi:hypothetical protein